GRGGALSTQSPCWPIHVRQLQKSPSMSDSAQPVRSARRSVGSRDRRLWSIVASSNDRATRLSLSETQTRTYWWWSPPKSGTTIIRPALRTARGRHRKRATSASAIGAADAGFCPVISAPSSTTFALQFLLGRLKFAPFSISLTDN